MVAVEETRAEASALSEKLIGSCLAAGFVDFAAAEVREGIRKAAEAGRVNLEQTTSRYYSYGKPLMLHEKGIFGIKPWLVTMGR